MAKNEIGWSTIWKPKVFDINPEGKEIAELKRVARWRTARVLDVGCGDGRLSLQMAALGAHVLGIDPEPSQIRAARRQVPKRLADRVDFRVGTVGDLAGQSGLYDIILFSLSL